MSRVEPDNGPWPELPFEEWKDTLATLHMWTQIVGKIRVAYAPWVNHQWHVTLHLSARGLTSRPIPWGDGTFQIDFDFVDHELVISKSDGGRGRVALEPRSVADFHDALMGELRGIGIVAEIHPWPNEVIDPVPFRANERDAAYDAASVHRFWRALTSAAVVMEDFRGRFIGKCSPVHFFWGAPDLAVTRFSGERAPEHPGGVPNLPDWVTREAYSHQLSSAGFWPGGEAYPHPFFYSYAYPTPSGYSEEAVRPAEAHWDEGMSEFILPYEDVRKAPSPERHLMDFLESTYEAAATTGGWDRKSLEWASGERPTLSGPRRW